MRKENNRTSSEFMKSVLKYESGQNNSQVFAVLIDKNMTLMSSHYNILDSHRLAINYHDQKKDKMKQKEFHFDGILTAERKLKHFLDQHLSNCISDLFKGINQSIMILGREEVEKQKLIFGQIKAPGLVLTLLKKVFEFAHKKNIQSSVSLKLSGFYVINNNFRDLVINTGVPLNIFSDPIEDDYPLGSVQVIVRNLKTALSIIRLIFDNYQSQLQRKSEIQDIQNNTLVISIKIQIIKGSIDQRNFSFGRLSLIKVGDEISQQGQFQFQSLEFLEFTNLLREINKVESKEFRQQKIDLVKNSILVQYLKNKVLKSSKLYSFFLLNKKLGTSNSAYNTIVNSKYLANLKLNTKLNSMHIPERYQRINSIYGIYSKMLLSVSINLKRFTECKELDRVLSQSLSMCRMTLNHSFQLFRCYFVQMYTMQTIAANYLTIYCRLYDKNFANDEIQDFHQAKKQTMMPVVEQTLLKPLIFWIRSLQNLKIKMHKIPYRLNKFQKSIQQALLHLKKQLDLSNEESLHIFQVKQDLVNHVLHLLALTVQFFQIIDNLSIHFQFDIKKAPPFPKQLDSKVQNIITVLSHNSKKIQNFQQQVFSKYFQYETKDFKNQPAIEKKPIEIPKEKEDSSQDPEQELNYITTLQQQSFINYKSRYSSLQSVLSDKEAVAQAQIRALMERTKAWIRRRGRKLRQCYSYDRVIERMFNNQSFFQR